MPPIGRGLLSTVNEETTHLIGTHLRSLAQHADSGVTGGRSETLLCPRRRAQAAVLRLEDYRFPVRRRHELNVRRHRRPSSWTVAIRQQAANRLARASQLMPRSMPPAGSSGSRMDAVPVPVEAEERVLHDVLGRAAIPEHDEPQPDQTGRGGRRVRPAWRTTFQVAERVSSVSIAPRESLCLVVDGKQTRRVGRFNRPQQHKFTGQYGFGGDVRLQSRAGLARAETRPRTLTATAHERGRD